MPGSPYLEEPPKRLTTWKRVLSFSIPILLVSTTLAIMYGVVFEMLVGYTVVFTLSAILRK